MELEPSRRALGKGMCRSPTNKHPRVRRAERVGRGARRTRAPHLGDDPSTVGLLGHLLEHLNQGLGGDRVRPACGRCEACGRPVNFLDLGTT